MKLKRVTLDSLHHDAGNARTHDERNVEAIRASLSQFGQVEPLVVQAGTGRVIGGNGRLTALRAMGRDDVEVVEVDVDDVTATALGIALNRTAELAGWDDNILAQHLAALQNSDLIDVAATGFGDKEIDALISMAAGGDVVEDAVPEVPEEPITKSGDLLVLGDHRVLCGDATEAEDVARVMGGEKADCVFTDPPYNVAGENYIYAANVSKSMAVLKDADWDKGFDLRPALDALLLAVSDDATVYVCTSHHLAHIAWEWMAEWAAHHSWCVWEKPNPMPSLSKRHWTWNAELVAYATRGKHTFNFPDGEHAPSVWTFTKHKETDHPTEKPVEVPAHAIGHSSVPTDLIFDPFLGSGTTLIAAEQLGRRCFGLEISPQYVDVIVQRWTNLTGEKARRESA
jgi:DNA modification methylase